MTTAIPLLPVYILAGGQSSRFGKDKALAEIGDTATRQPMIAKVAAQWKPWASRLVVVADRAGKYESCGLMTIADRQPGLGPIGGLLTALEDCAAEEDWLWLVACDAIVATEARGAASVVELLMAAISNDVKVVALKSEQWETMPALYHSSMLQEVRRSVQQGERALWRLIERVPHRAVEITPEQSPLVQINTQEDLRRFQARPQK